MELLTVWARTPNAAHGSADDCRRLHMQSPRARIAQWRTKHWNEQPDCNPVFGTVSRKLTPKLLQNLGFTRCRREP